MISSGAVDVRAGDRYTQFVGFEIVLHGGLDIIEVVYPAAPTAADVAAYLVQMRKVIDDRGGRHWSCLVDQRLLRQLDAALVAQLATLNAYAQQHGMLRSARVVGEGAGATRAESQRIAESAGLAVEVRSFTSREEAIEWLLPP